MRRHVQRKTPALFLGVEDRFVKGARSAYVLLKGCLEFGRNNVWRVKEAIDKGCRPVVHEVWDIGRENVFNTEAAGLSDEGTDIVIAM